MYSTMIQANELRIGNWVIDDEGHNGQVACLMSDKKNNWEDEDEKFVVEFPNDDFIYESKYFLPIPLTPDILEKCGFDYNVDFHLNAKGFSICFEKSGNNLMCFVECVGIDINYLHQLQNLIFALTGSELTFTPNPTP